MHRSTRSFLAADDSMQTDSVVNTSRFFVPSAIDVVVHVHAVSTQLTSTMPSPGPAFPGVRTHSTPYQHEPCSSTPPSKDDCRRPFPPPAWSTHGDVTGAPSSRGRGAEASAVGAAVDAGGEADPGAGGIVTVLAAGGAPQPATTSNAARLSFAGRRTRATYRSW